MPVGLNRIYAATLQSGHEVKLIDLMAEKDLQSAVKRAITSFNPEIIGISVRNVDDQNMENPRFLLDQVKKIVAYCRDLSRAPIVLGGAGYSIFPESALDYLEADMGIQGEGEFSFSILLDCISRGESLSNVPGLYLRRAGLQGKRIFGRNLDEFILPGPESLYPSIQKREEFWVPLQTRRGCPMACSYCSSAIIEGSSIRKRRTDFVIKEIADYVASGFQKFYFVDNIFNIPENYAKEICRKIIE
ncbi:MAG: cobalamin-dependent protein, partial [Smithella sp.]